MNVEATDTRAPGIHGVAGPLGWSMRGSVFPVLAAVAVMLLPGDIIRAQVMTADARAEASKIDNLLSRPVTLTITRSSRKHAVDMVSKKAGVPVQYQVHLLDAFRDSLTLQFKATPLRDVLNRILEGTGLRVIPDGQTKLAIVRGEAPRANAAAQEKGSITGEITDQTTRRPIRGASILLDATKIGASTGENGKFTISNVSAGEHILSIKALGYRSVEQRITVTSGQFSTVAVALAPAATTLTDVVTTATGDRRRLDIGNSVTTLNVDSIRRDAPIHTVTDLLETRVPDLIVTRGSGAPGAPSRIRVRGISSISGSSDPIIIVDNVRVYSEQTSTTALGDVDYSVLDNIDVNSIESIDVLKGPSASALYGSDAANGVIVIKTKRGVAGPTRWTISTDQAMTSQPAYSAAHAYAEGTPFMGGLPQQCIPGSYDACNVSRIIYYDPIGNKETSVFGRGHDQRYVINVNGGTPTVRYFLGAQTGSQAGLLKMSDADRAYVERITGKSVPEWQRKPQSSGATSGNVALTLYPMSTLTLNLTSALGRNTRSTTPLANALGIYQRALPQDTSLVTGRLPEFRERTTWAEKSSLSTISGDWNPKTWFTGHSDIGLQSLDRSSKSLLRRDDCPDCVDNTGRLSSEAGDRSVTTVNMRGSARLPRLRGIMLTPSVGFNYVRTIQEDLRIYATNLALGSSSIEGAINKNITQDTRAKLVQLGVFVSTDVNLFDRITTSFGFRSDASNSLGKEVTPTYPKFDISYVLPVENWISPSTLRVFRIRTAYGHSAKQPEIGSSVRTYKAIEGTREDGSLGSVLYLSTLGNPYLKPERSTDFEGGFDVTGFDDRITLSVTTYRKITRDALVAVQQPISLGGESPRSPYFRTVSTNLGRVKNVGGNATLEARVIDRAALNWGVNLTYDRNRNTLLKLAPSFDRNFQNTSEFGGKFTGRRYIEGYPIDGVWLLPITTYADINGDGYIAHNEIVRSDSSVYVGGPLPNYTATFGTTIGLWNGRVTIAGNARYESGMAQINQPLLFQVDDRYPQSTTIPQLNDPAVPLDIQAAYRSGYAAVHQASVWRFQTLSIRGSVPDVYAQRLFRAKTMSVALQGNNLKLWTNYSGADPNVLKSLDGNSAVDTGVLPLPRTWGLNVTLTY